MKQHASPKVQILDLELQVNRNIPFELTPNSILMFKETKKAVIRTAILLSHSQLYEEKGPICCPWWQTPNTLHWCHVSLCSPEGCATDVREEIIIGEEENSFLE